MRWRQSLEALAGLGATRFVEVGTGGVLTGLARRTLPDATASAVATPTTSTPWSTPSPAATPVTAYAAAHQGEHLYTSERVVISPSAGVFEPVAGLAAPGPVGLSPDGTEGAPVAVGDLLGTVGAAEVRTPFAGWWSGSSPIPGERVAAGEPIAWLASRPTARELTGSGRSPDWGAALPDTVVTNADLEARLDTTDDGSSTRSGIRERRIGGTVSSLAIDAGRRALERAGLAAGAGATSSSWPRAHPTWPCRPPRPPSTTPSGCPAVPST